MISRRNHTRRRLNQITQTILITTGHVTDIHDYGTGRFGVGDRVITTAPDRSLHPPRRPDRYLANGTTGTITHTHPDGLTVEFDRLGTITIPTSRVGILDLGYALTAYSVQGATLDEAEAIATPGEPIESVYVALTRGRQANTLIATTPPPVETHQPDIGSGLDPVVGLAEMMTDNDQVPALVADPDLAYLVDPSPSMPARVRERLDAVEVARAVSRAHLDPPAGFLDRHGPRPATPWLAEQWDVALTAAATEDYLQERSRRARVRERRVGMRRPPGRGGLTR